MSIPYQVSEVKELSSFFSSTTNTGTSRRPIMETKSILELSSGETYRIGKFPVKDYKKGQKLKILESLIFNNVNELIMIQNNSQERIHVGLFSNLSLISLFSFSILISLLNIFFKNKMLNIALIASTMFISIVSMVYIFYY